MMMYNMDFEICALGMLLLVLASIPIHNTLRTFSNRLFLVFTICGIFDILFDIASAVTMAYPEIYPLWARWGALQIYFLLQLLMPYLLLLYVFSLRGALKRENALPIGLCSAGFVFMLGLVLTNPFLGGMSWFDAAGRYHHGPFYYATYIYAFTYMLMALIDTWHNRQSFPRRSGRSIWKFCFICAFMVAIQMAFNHILLTGVGIAASLIVLLLTVNNPLNKMDPLTGMFDASALQETLREEMRRGNGLRTIVIALDNLKRINLVFSIDAGNRVLKECAGQFTSFVGNDNAFRFLGDRFVLICRSEEDYHTTMEKVRALFRSPWPIEQAQVHLTACICGIPDPSRHTRAGELLDFMDYLMSRAKINGAGSFLEDNDTITAKYRRHKEIETYLYTAVEQNLFEVYFQPIYSLEREQYVSAEALVRLRHPDYGMLSPGEFIPIAERSGEIARVEQAIFEKLCLFLQANPEVAARLENIKFNLSPASFLSVNQGAIILRKIREHGLETGLFQFEITETTATVYDAELLNWAHKIRTAGAGLCLDDFGSGYANLSAVMKLPFDVVKMDRSMLLDAAAHPQAAILYGKLVDALTGLGFRVVAEGAETEEEMQFLRRVKVQYIQGFYYSRPLPPAEFLRLVLALPEKQARS